MKVDPTMTKTVALALLTAAAWMGCHSHDEDSHTTPTGHTSPYPACNAILEACHQFDIGEGPIHNCHETGHDAKSDSDCTPVKEACLQLCAAAKADAGSDAGQ